MFSYVTTIKMHNVDAAQRLFFADQFVIAHDAWEACLAAHDFGIGVMLDECDFVTPIVHAEADYKAPVKLGSEVAVTVTCEAIGETSFTIEFTVNTDSCVGRVTHVHVVTDKATGNAIPVPDLLRNILVRIGDG